MVKITKSAVDAVVADPARQILVWDDQLKGFGFYVKPSGSKSFFIQYRNSEGRSHRMTLGKYGVLTAEQARAIAQDKLHSVRKGEDPIRDRRSARDAMTVRELCDWYLVQAEQGALVGRRGRPIKATTLEGDRSRIEKHVKPLIGGRSIKALTRADIAEMQSRILAGKTAKDRGPGRGGQTTGGAGVAGRTLATVSAMFGQAERAGMIASNPARGVKRFADGGAQRVLTRTEIASLGAIMAKAQASDPVAVAAIRFLLLTGFRRMEALGLRLDWIDKERQCIAFPDTKAGPQRRPVGRAALRVLDAVKRGKGDQFAFPSSESGKHYSAVPAALKRLCEAVGLADVTPHTLRHTFATVASELELGPFTVAGLLGHSAGGVTGGYVHLDKSLVAAADLVALEMDRLLGFSSHAEGIGS